MCSHFMIGLWLLDKQTYKIIPKHLPHSSQHIMCCCVGLPKATALSVSRVLIYGLRGPSTHHAQLTNNPAENNEGLRSARLATIKLIYIKQKKKHNFLIGLLLFTPDRGWRSNSSRSDPSMLPLIDCISNMYILISFWSGPSSNVDFIFMLHWTHFIRFQTMVLVFWYNNVAHHQKRLSMKLTIFWLINNEMVWFFKHHLSTITSHLIHKMCDRRIKSVAAC